MAISIKNAPGATGAKEAVRRRIASNPIIHEIANILRDIHSGALPLTEVPRFLLWLLGGSA